MVKLDFTLHSFPSTGAIKDATGLPFSCVLQPFSKLPANADKSQNPNFLEVLRCNKCFGYINSHCTLTPPTWHCSLCGHDNDIKQMWSRKYSQGAASLPELKNEVYEMIMDETAAFGADTQGDAQGPAPILLALIDLTAGEEWLDLVRSALMAALEAVPPYTLFGLITFSHRLGLYDLRSPVPSVRYVELRESATQPVVIPCAQVLPLRALLAPVGQFKDRINETLDALVSESAPEPAAAPSPQAAPGGGSGDGLQHAQMQRSGKQTGRGFGPALLALLEYLQAVTRAPFRPTADQLRSSSTSSMAAQQSGALPPSQSPVRLMTFLSGPPDWGTGRLLNPKQHARNAAKIAMQAAGAAAEAGGSQATPGHAPHSMALLPDDSWLQDVGPSAVQFYQQASVAAASLGCCCDLFTMCEGAVGLQYLEPLANSTGGAMYMYSSVDDSALPQDVYRRLAAPHAAAAVLRVRCSPAFKTVRHYGRLFPDQQVENLHHIVSGSDTDTFAIDFELTSPAGFTAHGHQSAYLQVAVQYTTVIPVAGDPSSSSGGAGGSSQGPAGSQPPAPAQQASRCMLQRRLRVATFKVPCSSSPLEVMRSCSPEALLVVLLHKINKVAQMQGAARARVVLRDWLANLTANYHHQLHAAVATKGAAALLQVPVDVSFSQAEPLQPVPRLVYALLRSPMLAPPIESQHPDLISFMTHLWSSLPPSELQRAVYPALSSYADPDTLVLSRHSLSRGALLAQGAPPIFLLDAYVLLVVLYTSGAPPTLPFPPPQVSQLRRTLASIRQDRRITPQVRFVREGTEEAALFFHLLLDEPDNNSPTVSAAEGAREAGQTPAAASYGLVQFLEHIRLEVVAALRNEAQALGKD